MLGNQPSPPAPDAELKAIGEAYEALRGLSAAGIIRAMDWIHSRWKEDHDQAARYPVPDEKVPF